MSENIKGQTKVVFKTRWGTIHVHLGADQIQQFKFWFDLKLKEMSQKIIQWLRSCYWSAIFTGIGVLEFIQLCLGHITIEEDVIS